nr:hypothetical protein [Tanacetum cinerariifolium]
MASLADKAILSGTENCPPMLEKDMYNSWRSTMEMYMLNRQHGRIILESVEHGPLLWPFVTEEGVTRLKKYSELSAAEAIQADCDVKATNIIIQALPLEIYALVSFAKEELDFLADPGTTESSTNSREAESNVGWFVETLDAYDSDCDELNSAKVALMANFSHYGSNNLAEVNNLNNMSTYLIHQEMHVPSTSEQSTILAQSNTESTSDSNIISYSKYINESQYNTVQNFTLPASQDDLILSMIEQLKTQVVNYTKINQDNKQVNELLTAEIKRYINQERILKEQINNNQASTSYENS